MIVWARTAIAALVLIVALGPTATRGALADLRRRPGSALLLSFFAIALPFSLITLGEHTVPSGLTAVLIAPTSQFVAMFAPFIDPSESIDRRQAVGMVIGLSGVALVVGVETVHSTGQLLGALAMIGAAASYGLSGFVVNGRYQRLTSTQTSLISVFSASLLTLPFAVATAPRELPDLRASLSVLALGAIGTALAFVISYKLVIQVGPARASLVSYLAPGVALFYGALLNGEAITVAAVAGLVLILGGVALGSGVLRVGRRREPVPAAPHA